MYHIPPIRELVKKYVKNFSTGGVATSTSKIDLLCLLYDERDTYGAEFTACLDCASDFRE